MIKMPIRLETRPEWKELLSDAFSQRNNLERLAGMERQLTGEYIRPIMLIQAQSRRQGIETLTVETIEKCLMEDFNVPRDYIARATGTDYEIEGVDLLREDCKIKYIITIQALREGWDCPFAYVLCSVADVKSSRPVEQILGRILRMPKAERKEKEGLNLAYAFSTSQNFSDSANALTDALIENGFDKLEAKDMIVRAYAEQTEIPIRDGDLFGQPVVYHIPEMPDLTSLPSFVNNSLEFNPGRLTMTVVAPVTPEVKDAVLEHTKSSGAKAVLEKILNEIVGVKPPIKKIISIPMLAIKTGDLFEQFEENHLLDREWNLADFDSHLTEQEYSSVRQTGGIGEISIADSGHLQFKFMPELALQMALLDGNRYFSQSDLIVWLDRNIPHHDIPPDQSALFILNAIEFLMAERNLTLDELNHDKFRLRQAISDKIQQHRITVKAQAYQSLLFPEECSPVVINPGIVFSYDPLKYPCSRICQGRYRWRKHFYSQVGDLKNDGEEYDCAIFIDQMPEVESWVRNLERRPNTSFWLQTSTDKFYPDFVCLLKDGRYLVIEYKGADRWTNDDSKEKRMIGEIWEKRSGGKCLFIMPLGKDFAAIRTKTL
jgi:type III restriction enzyme